MKTKLLYIERKPYGNVSIEKVFQQISRTVSKEKFEVLFQTLPYLNSTLGMLKNLLFYRKLKADIYHITGHNHYIALILPKKNTILTIHDLGILRVRKGLRRYIIKKINFDFPVKKMKYVTAVSETTKKDIIAFTNCAPEKIRIVENPLPEYFILSNQVGIKKFDIVCPTVLQIGTAHNKNLDNLIAALEGINCRLIIVGNLNGELERKLKFNRIVYENKYNLTDAEIREEYLKADIVTFCSTFEGFGLPIIEAQSMRKPVITSNLSPMREVAGEESAFFADPNDYLSIRKGFLKIIKDQNYREELIMLGSENVKRFNAQAITSLYENIYQEIINDTKSS